MSILKFCVDILQDMSDLYSKNVFSMVMNVGEKPTGKYIDECKFAFKGLMQERPVRQFISD